MNKNNTMIAFVELVRRSVMEDGFVRLTLSSYTGAEKDLKKVIVRMIEIKGADHLSFTYRYKTKDIVKNKKPEEAFQTIKDLLEQGFGAAMLLTLSGDCAYPSMKKTPGTVKEAPPKSHDRAKQRKIETAGKKYLHALGVTDAQGTVIKSAQDKYRQIDKYVETLSTLLKTLPKNKIIKVADMGSGKGYLTFALYDYLMENGYEAEVTGVEFRKDMVDLCNQIAGDCGFERLKFIEGAIDSYDAPMDVLIALHACDTATDDAISMGIKNKADVIVVAPCCHKQIRRAIDPSKTDPALSALLEHGIFMERQAEMVTDTIRALIMHAGGYETKVFEFISDSHTPKNVMITGVKGKSKARVDQVLEKIKHLKAAFGIQTHALEHVLEYAKSKE